MRQRAQLSLQEQAGTARRCVVPALRRWPLGMTKVYKRHLHAWKEEALIAQNNLAIMVEWH